MKSRSKREDTAGVFVRSADPSGLTVALTCAGRQALDRLRLPKPGGGAAAVPRGFSSGRGLLLQRWAPVDLLGEGRLLVLRPALNPAPLPWRLRLFGFLLFK